MMVVLVGLEFPRGYSSGGHELRGADYSISSSLPRRVGLVFNFIPLGMEDNMPADNVVEISFVWMQPRSPHPSEGCSASLIA